MRFPRSSGVLLHISSLPGDCGIGDLGEGAYAFVDFLQRAGQHVWQVLPLGPPARGSSPYSSYSAFAGNALLISPQKLAAQGLMSSRDADEMTDAFVDAHPDSVDFDAVDRFKQQVVVQSHRHFHENADVAHRAEFDDFCTQNGWWLDDFALFAALRREFDQTTWDQWEPGLVRREPAAIQHWRDRLDEAIRVERHAQFVVLKQWRALKKYANRRGIQILGDLPLFVAYDSADVWVHQDLFCLDEQSLPTVVAGVPPDCFSATGQRWGNPLYDWPKHAATGFEWWTSRFRVAFASFDMLRIDHFRGLESYWAIPAASDSAVHGAWLKGPGAAPIEAARRELGDIRLVAEDLGMITAEVHQLRDQLDLPGMRILQFGFGDPKDTFHRPDQFPNHCVAYTGTHDNDTVVGWYRQLPDASRGLLETFLHSKVPNAASSGPSQVPAENQDKTEIEGTNACETDFGEQEIHWELIWRTLASAADTAIIPLQDILGLGHESRMNTPGEADGNWRWRFTQGTLTPEIESRLRDLTVESSRS